MERFEPIPPGNPFVGVKFPESVKSICTQSFTHPTELAEPLKSRSPELLIRNLLPDGFPAYARICHPAYPQGQSTPVRWSEIARLYGKTAHPLMQFARLFGSTDYYADPPGYFSPEVGQLPPPEAKALVSILRCFTTIPEQCHLMVWEGYGGMELIYPETVKVVGPDRTYWVYEGSVDSAVELFEADFLFGPNLWMPKDYAWCVSTDIDLMDTFVGGSKECVNLILIDPNLEAYPVTPTDRVDFLGDTLNK